MAWMNRFGRAALQAVFKGGIY